MRLEGFEIVDGKVVDLEKSWFSGIYKLYHSR